MPGEGELEPENCFHPGNRGSGLIGSHTCEALITNGHQAVGLDNFDEFYDPAISVSTWSIMNHPLFSLIDGEVRDERALEQPSCAGLSATSSTPGRGPALPRGPHPLM
jgi:nucleoside-diphosphate-sugar epimerase